MSKYFHHKPNVPQPPYNLNYGQDAAGPSVQPPPRGSSALRHAGSQANLGRVDYRAQQAQSLPPAVPSAPSRAPAPAPAPVVTPPSPPQDCYNPHQQSYHALNNLPLRSMSAEQRQAYIRSVDARNAASTSAMPMATPAEPRMSGLRPLQLAASSLQTKEPSAPNTPGTPPSDDEGLLNYLKQLQGTDDAEAPQQVEEAPADVPQTPSPAPPAEDGGNLPDAPPAQTAEEPDAAEPATYAETAHNVDPSFRVPATAIYDFASEGAPATRPATPEPVAAQAPLARPLSLPVEAQQLAGGDVSIEVFSAQRSLVARLLLKGLIPQG